MYLQVCGGDEKERNTRARSPRWARQGGVMGVGARCARE
jgi:hypothetical protein